LIVSAIKNNKLNTPKFKKGDDDCSKNILIVAQSQEIARKNKRILLIIISNDDFFSYSRVALEIKLTLDYAYTMFAMDYRVSWFRRYIRN